MSKIVAVHGIAQQYKGPDMLHQEWFAPLCDGITLAGGTRPASEDLICVFYANLFRAKELRPIEQIFDASAITDPYEIDLLMAWYEEVADAGPDRLIKDSTPQFIQRALETLSHSKFFAGLAEKAFVFNLKQVCAYFNEDAVRLSASQQVDDAISNDTRVLIGHSLGSIVAYEYLCANPLCPVMTLITLGSPLGIRNVIFDRLWPPPVNGHGEWPGSVKHWVNIADNGDVVALVKDLRPQFGPNVRNFLVDNGAEAHNANSYLTAPETGRAIISGLER